MTTELAFKTPLYDQHIELNAKMVEFGGWLMPLQYDSIFVEHAHNRQRASLFDCSHMGEFFISGDAVSSGLDRIVTQNIVDMPVKTCRYGAMLNDGGGVIDDLIVYRLDQDQWMFVVNAANIVKDSQHIQSHLTSEAIFEDRSNQTAKLDLQGPLSRDILKQLIPDIVRLEYYGFDYFQLLGERVLISRTGYTGELGYEIYCSAEKAPDLWKSLLKNEQLNPTGLGVRDVLRIEMCYSLYGHELSDEISPLDAGLRPFIEFDKDFIGKESLVHYDEQGLKSKVVCLHSQSKRSPREGHSIFNQHKQHIGEVKSGSFSPALDAGIGLGFVDLSAVKVGDTVLFGDEKKQHEAAIVKRPFYRGGSLKN